MGLVGNGWANCFRTHNELTMGLLGTYPLAPSEEEFWRLQSDANTKVKHEETKAKRSVGMIGNSLDHVSGSWERNESAQNKGNDKYGKEKRRNNRIHE